MEQLGRTPRGGTRKAGRDYTNICKKISFHRQERSCLIFVTRGDVVKYDFERGRESCLFDFADVDEQPESFVFNDDQTACVIATTRNSRMIDFGNNQDHDLAHLFGISQIKAVLYFEGYFYVMANKREQRLGFYLLRIPQRDPVKAASGEDWEKEKEEMFFMNYRGKLEIGDVDMHILKEDGDTHLIVSYKTIYINVYSLKVIDLERRQVIYRHESFCLWETHVSGFLNNSTLDFISLDQNGLGVMALSSKFLTKQIKDHEDQNMLVHSLSSCQYLRLGEGNHLLFQCSQKNRMIGVYDNYKNELGETIFEPIFKIRVCQANIRELLLLQSIYHCETLNDIETLVGMQGNPMIFYNSYLELDRRNLVSILAFNSNTIK